jgi:hypothetical protein
MYQTKGPWFQQEHYDPAALTVRDVGSATMNFRPRAFGAQTMEFEVTMPEGRLVKTLVRQPFGDSPRH